MKPVDELVAMYAVVVETPRFILLDMDNKTEDTVAYRRHLVWWLVVSMQVPVAAVADVLGMSRATVWRYMTRHRDKSRNRPGWASDCHRVEDRLEVLL